MTRDMTRTRTLPKRMRKHTGNRNIKLGVIPDSIEGKHTKAQAAICADPSAKARIVKKATKKRGTAAKIGLEARKAKVAAVFVRKKGTLWKLRVAVDGLCEAGKEWYTRFPRKPVAQYKRSQESCNQVSRESCRQVSREKCCQIPKETCNQVSEENCRDHLCLVDQDWRDKFRDRSSLILLREEWKTRGHAGTAC